jgi:thiol-disulfide isomerase/thioredoxin
MVAPAYATLLAKAIVGLGVAFATPFVRGQEGTPLPPPTFAQKLQVLLERFHRVMPQQPELLRNAAVRTRIAPQALPVLRELRALLATGPTGRPTDPAAGDQSARAEEFTIYALVLADAKLQTELAAKVRAGDASATLLVESAAVITAADANTRGKAVAAIAKGLAGSDGKQGLAAPSAVRCLLIAGDLSSAEATQLAKATLDPQLAEQLTLSAQERANDARQYLDKPFVLAGTQANGEEFSTASLLGKVILIDFWATWCGPCVRTLPQVEALHTKLHEKGLEVVGISSDREATALSRFLTEHPAMTWPQLFDTNGKGWHPLNTKYGVSAIPRMFLIDRKGVLRSVDAQADLEALLLRLLAE